MLSVMLLLVNGLAAKYIWVYMSDSTLFISVYEWFLTLVVDTASKDFLVNDMIKMWFKVGMYQFLFVILIYDYNLKQN